MSVTSARALAAASAALVVDHDVIGTLTALVRGSLDGLRADASGIVVADQRGRLELLVASSHEDAELALYEEQHHDGPCAEAWAAGDAATAAGIEATADRWPELAALMAAAGLGSVLAIPLHWNERPLGALNVFRRSCDPFSGDDIAIAQAFADMATLVVIHTDHVGVRSAALRVDEALAGRVAIEQAKGVLAYRHGLSMAQAFEHLQSAAGEQGLTLTEAARTVIRVAERDPR